MTWWQIIILVVCVISVILFSLVFVFDRYCKSKMDK